MKYERIHREFLESGQESLKCFVLNRQREVYTEKQRIGDFCPICILREIYNECKTCESNKLIEELGNYWKELDSFYRENNLEDEI